MKRFEAEMDALPSQWFPQLQRMQLLVAKGLLDQHVSTSQFMGDMPVAEETKWRVRVLQAFAESPWADALPSSGALVPPAVPPYGHMLVGIDQFRAQFSDKEMDRQWARFRQGQEPDERTLVLTMPEGLSPQWCILAPFFPEQYFGVEAYWPGGVQPSPTFAREQVPGPPDQAPLKQRRQQQAQQEGHSAVPTSEFGPPSSTPPSTPAASSTSPELNANSEAALPGQPKKRHNQPQRPRRK